MTDMRDECGEAGPLVSFGLPRGHGFGPRLGISHLISFHHAHLVLKSLRQLLVQFVRALTLLISKLGLLHLALGE